jgi:hypothetical protein
MVELLFGLLPSELRKSGIRQVARFVLGKVLPSVTHEASLLCNAAASADPDTAASLLAGPLLSRVEDELASAHSAVSASRTGELSKVCTTPPCGMAGLCVYVYTFVCILCNGVYTLYSVSRQDW